MLGNGMARRGIDLFEFAGDEWGGHAAVHQSARNKRESGACNTLLKRNITRSKGLSMPRSICDNTRQPGV